MSNLNRPGQYATALRRAASVSWRAARAADNQWLRTHDQFAADIGLLQERLASEVMSRDCPSVPGEASLAEFVEHYLLRNGRRCYVVGESEAPRGIITLSDALSIPRDEWSRTSVQAAMRRADQIYSVTPDTEIEAALSLMDEKNVAQVPVMLDGRLLGMISRNHLIRLILNRMALTKS